MVFTLYRFTWSGGSRELTRNSNQTQPGHGTVNWEFCRDLGAFDGVSTSKTAGPVCVENLAAILNKQIGLIYALPFSFSPSFFKIWLYI